MTLMLTDCASNTNKGVVSGLEHAAEALCLSVALDILWDYLRATGPNPNELDVVTFREWLMGLRGEHKGEAESNRIFASLAGGAPNITKARWTDPQNISNLGEGRFPSWKTLLESCLSFEKDPNIIVEQVRNHPNWKKAERIMGEGILGRHPDEEESLNEGLLGEVRNLMDEGSTPQ